MKKARSQPLLGHLADQTGCITGRDMGKSMCFLSRREGMIYSLSRTFPMSHSHDRLLQTILQEPLSGNIHWRDVESLLHHIGAVVEPGHGARMKIELNGVIGTLHRPHHSGVCSKQDIRHLRDYLTSAGVTPSAQ
jgi:hypothetical protein